MTDYYDDTQWRAQQAAKAEKARRARDAESDARLRANVAADLANQATNPALRDVYTPEVWTPEMETDLAERIHGTEAERIARMMGRPEPKN